MHTLPRILGGFRASARGWSIAAVAVVALLLGLGSGSPAAADDCVALGGVDGVECVIGGVVPGLKTGPFNLDKTLHFTAGGQLNVGAAGIVITISSGDFVMDDNTLLNGNGANGAPIKVELLDGDINLKTGSTIRSNGGAGGFIQLLTSASHTADIDGTVESVGTNSGTGQAGGGPITIRAGCVLTISDTGKVSSRGLDPGADLVHLEGCVVEVLGLVESTGSGHHVPTTPANSCSNAPSTGARRNPETRPGKPLNSTGCVEIWAGTTLLIDSTGTHKGEVNADIGFQGGPGGRGWIDLLANGDITIKDGTGNDRDFQAGSCTIHTTFAVHANGGLCQNTDDGGLILIQSYTGSVIASGNAIQADAITAGGTGGEIRVEAQQNIDFTPAAGGANLFARGDFDPTGGLGLGGKIGPTVPTDLSLPGPAPIRAFLGFLDWTSGIGDARPAGGEVNLRACLAAGGVTTGPLPNLARFPITPTVTNDLVCAGAPTKPTYANPFPSGTCDTQCGQQPAGNKSGVKFSDVNQNGTQDAGEPGLVGWSIYVFNTGTLALVQTVVTLPADPLALPPTPDGFYSFNLDPGSYTVCEEQRAGFTQTAPLPGSVPPPIGETLANCAAFGIANGLALAPRGYNFTILTTEIFANNNFGNFQPAECPEDTARAAKLTRVVDQTGKSHGPAPVYLTVQAAYDAAVLPNEVIGLFSQTTENVVLGGAKSLTITQCSNARVTALDSTKPAWTISSSQPLLIIGPDAVGGKVGWLISTAGHELKGLRANGSTLYGIQVVGANNKVAWNSVKGIVGGANSAGIRVESNGNDLRGGTVSGNTGDGVQIVGGTNSFQGATVESNTGNGVSISGTNNTIKGNKANKNGGAGFLTTATATGNKFQSNTSNASSSGGSNENGGPEYKFGAPEVNQGSNKADNVTIPTAAKCPTLFSAGGNCE